MFKWPYLQYSCPLKNSMGKKWTQERHVEMVLKRKLDNFLTAPRHELLKYAMENIALLTNTLCVHKLYKVECLNKIYLKWAVHFFY